MNVSWRRAAAYVVCRDVDDRLLLTRFVTPGHPDDGKWTMPGGGMEWGETPEQTAAREVEEETGLHATIGPVVGVFSRWFTAPESARGEPGHTIGVVYEASDRDGRLRAEFDDDTTTDAAGRFTLSQVRELPRVELVDFVLGLLGS